VNWVREAQTLARLVPVIADRSGPTKLTSLPASPAQGAVAARHGPLLFSALKAAMADPGHAADPLLAREYLKLFTAASKIAEVCFPSPFLLFLCSLCFLVLFGFLGRCRACARSLVVRLLM
jgi:hypothetical protein